MPNISFIAYKSIISIGNIAPVGRFSPAMPHIYYYILGNDEDLFSHEDDDIESTLKSKAIPIYWAFLLLIL